MHGRKAVSRVVTLSAALCLAGPPIARAADAAYGQYLAGECAACHRADGQDKGIAVITGWPVEQFVAVLQAYKLKERPNVVMQTIAGRLSADEMAALADYYGSLAVKK